MSENKVEIEVQEKESFVKVTRNIKAHRVEKCDAPVEFPESGVLYEFDITDWQNRTAFYDKIAFSFGIPSTQKQVHCDYFNCKVMHYERTCQGVYFCQNAGNDPNSKCTVKPCRFRFHVCDVHRIPLIKSTPCKLKLHFYLPMDKEDNRRLMICLGTHNHQNLTLDDTVLAPEKNPTIKVEDDKLQDVIIEEKDEKTTPIEKVKVVIPKIELNPPVTSPRMHTSNLTSNIPSPHQLHPVISPKPIRSIPVRPEIPKIGNFTSIHQFQQFVPTQQQKLSPKLSPHSDRDQSPYHMIHSRDSISPSFRDMIPSPRDHTQSPNFHREHLFSPALQQPYHMRDMTVSPQPRDFLTPSPSLDRLSPWMFDKSPRYYSSVGLPVSGRNSSTENSPRDIFEQTIDRKRKLGDVNDPVGETGISDLTLNQKRDEDEHDPDMVKIALPPITSFDSDPFPFSVEKKKKL